MAFLAMRGLAIRATRAGGMIMKSGISSGARAASKFIMGFGLVSMLMDIVYEGALSVQGPLLASLGASAATVGLISGLGEATSLAGRLVTGPLADRVGRYWLFAIAGYAITALAVPAMGLAGSVVTVGILVVVERMGKAVRTPSRDAMISHASAAVGRGKGFALHELMDQIGATLGPLIVSGILFATGGEYGRALGVMVLPGGGGNRRSRMATPSQSRSGPIRARRSRFGRFRRSSEWRCRPLRLGSPYCRLRCHFRCFGRTGAATSVLGILPVLRLVVDRRRDIRRAFFPYGWNRCR